MADKRVETRTIIQKIEKLLVEYKKQYPQNFAQCAKNRSPFLLSAILLLGFLLSLDYSDVNGVAYWGVVFFGLGSPAFLIAGFLDIKKNIDYKTFPNQIDEQLQQLEEFCGYSDIKYFYDRTLRDVNSLKYKKQSWLFNSKVIFGIASFLVFGYAFYLFFNGSSDKAKDKEMPIATLNEDTLRKTLAPNLLKDNAEYFYKSHTYAPKDDSLNMDLSKRVFDFSGVISVAKKEILEKYLIDFKKKNGIDAFAFFFEEDDSMYVDKGVSLYGNFYKKGDNSFVFLCSYNTSQLTLTFGEKLKERNINKKVHNIFLRQSWADCCHQAMLLFERIDKELNADNQNISNQSNTLDKNYRIYDFPGVLMSTALDSLNNKCFETQFLTGVEINFLIMDYSDTISDADFTKRCNDYHNKFKDNFAEDNLTFYIGFYDGKIHYESFGKAKELKFNQERIAIANNNNLVSQKIDDITNIICKRRVKNNNDQSLNLDDISQIWRNGNAIIFFFILPIRLFIISRFDEKIYKWPNPWRTLVGYLVFFSLLIFNTIMVVVYLYYYYRG